MKNKMGDKCFADSMTVEQEHNHVRLVAEVDGVLFDSGEYEGDTQKWLQAIVERVYDCAMGKLNERVSRFPKGSESIFND